MGYTTNTIFGGFTDPEASGTEPPGTTLNAVNELSPFADQITINLINDNGALPPYLSINNVTVSYTLAGTPITNSELTDGGNVTLNTSYVEPATNSFSGLNITTSFTSSSGNVYISGNISGAFVDSYWKYKNLTNNNVFVVNSVLDIPDEDNGIFVYKPSFMRYTNVIFTVNVEYDSANSTYEVRKKIANDWESKRLQLIAQIAKENTYRINNYPKQKNASSF